VTTFGGATGRFPPLATAGSPMQSGARTPLRDLRFRANPDYELVLFERLSPSEQELFRGLSTDPDGYGILRPREGSGLTVKSVSRDLALLLYTMREPGTFPRYALEGLGRQGDSAIAGMVLDGILEIESDGRMLSGAQALPCLSPPGDQIPQGRQGAIASLSLSALQYGQALDIAEPGLLSARLYDYNRIPASARWRSRFPDPSAVAELLDLENAAFGPFRSDGHWAAWQAAASGHGSSSPTFKLYVSPAIEQLRETLHAATAVAAVPRVFGMKVGCDLYGILRPDKIVLYLKTFSDLQETAARFLRRMSGCPGHGVPFSADLDGGTLLSWGVDPPRDAHSVPWLQNESWRIRVTNRLACALVLAKSSAADSDGVRIEPWRFAMERVRLEGVDTRTWTPSATGLYGHN